MMRIALLLVAAAAPCFAQVSARVSLSNGIQLTVATRSDNATPVTLKTSLEPASGDSFYRIFRDENNLAVFAYELEVARTPDGMNFRVTAKAATEDFAIRFPNADGGKPTPTLSTTLESPLLSSGEGFTIPIPTDPGLGQTLSDRVQILLGQRGGGDDGAAAVGEDPVFRAEGFYSWTAGVALGRGRRRSRAIRHVLHPRTWRLLLFHRTRGSAAVH